MRQKSYFDDGSGEPRPRAGRIPRGIRPRGGALGVGLVAVVAISLVLTAWITREEKDAASRSAGAASERVIAPPALHPVTIVVDEGAPRVATDRNDGSGATVTVRCGTCHASKPANPSLRTAAELDVFHQGLEFRHGELSCLACHDATNYDRLKSASGEAIEFADHQRLCVQCHGPTARDYEHGAHGGMTGHWDLSRGPRTRLGCTRCHDPHAPAYPAMTRTFFSIDRFAEDSHDRH